MGGSDHRCGAVDVGGGGAGLGESTARLKPLAERPDGARDLQSIVRDELCKRGFHSKRGLHR